MNCPTCGRTNSAEVEECPDCGTSLVEADSDPLLGRRLGQMVLQRKLGSGGMGSVYLARHVSLGTTFAVKVMHPGLVSDEGLRERFRREAVTASRLHHENVIFVTDFGWQKGVGCYIAMEYLQGSTLEEIIERPRALELADVLHVCRGIGAALSAAHAEAVVHRDLKPENVVLVPSRGGSDRVKVLDFGIAKVLEGEDQGALTSTGMALGTPIYMSPEQARGAVKEIGPWTDIYSFGVMIFEMLAGRPPFVGGSALSLLRSHLDARPPLLSEFVPRWKDSPLEQLLDRMLAKKPADRPSSTDEIAKVLNSELGAFEAAGQVVRFGAETPVPAAGPAKSPADPSPAQQPVPAEGGAESVRYSDDFRETVMAGSVEGDSVAELTFVSSQQRRRRWGLGIGILLTVIATSTALLLYTGEEHSINGLYPAATEIVRDGGGERDTEQGVAEQNEKAGPDGVGRDGGAVEKIVEGVGFHDAASSPSEAGKKRRVVNRRRRASRRRKAWRAEPRKKRRGRRGRLGGRSVKRRPIKRRKAVACELRIASIPVGATVWIGGKKQPGETPILLRRPKKSGRVRIMLKADGRRPLTFFWTPCRPETRMKVEKILSEDIGI